MLFDNVGDGGWNCLFKGVLDNPFPTPSSRLYLQELPMSDKNRRTPVLITVIS
jgi:hypothetical protein